MKARIYIVNGKPVTNTEEKPGWDMGFRPSDYAIKKWKITCTEVYNACEYDEPGCIVINPDSPNYEVVINGSLIEVEGKIITKIY